MNKDWAVITDNRDKVNKIFSEIKQQNKEIIQEYNTKSFKSILFKDCTNLFWLNPSINVREQKPTRVWIDKDIDKTILQEKILPILLFCKKENITWI